MQQPGRQRLRPWLEEQIQSGRYPGVSWLDQSARIFQIPWTHAARHGWSIDKDATLFRSWAIHTGRYHPGQDEPDPKTWKANFRCALNSLPDVCELQEQSRKRGSDAHRVYRMLPCSQALRRRRGLRLSRARHTHATTGSETHDTWSHETHHSGAPQGVRTPAGDGFRSHAQGTWGAEEQEEQEEKVQEEKEQEQEQEEAVFKLVDQLGHTDLWNQEQHRKWRTHTLWDHWDCMDDEASYFLHTENCADVLGPHHFKELSDWSVNHQQSQLCANGSLTL